MTLYATDFKREVIYQIVTDRFFDGDAANNDPPQSPGLFDGTHKNWQAYWGGDLEGVRQKIPYLAGLGVTAIWISPPADNINAKIGKTASYYGYQARDFKRIEEHFGDPANSWGPFDKLVATAHEWGIKVIVDFAANHSNIYIVGEYGALYDNGVFLADYFHDPNNYFRRLGFITAGSDAYETQYFSLYGLSDINQENERMDDYLKSAVLLYQQHGADGFRIDGVKHVTWGWMYSLANTVFTNGNSFMFGEWYLQDYHTSLGWEYVFANSIYDADSSFTFDTMQTSIADPLAYDAYKFTNRSSISLNDFPLHSAMWNVFGSDTDFSEIDSVITETSQSVSDPENLVTFIDSQDSTRFLSVHPNLDRYHAALAFLLTARGIPCLYYGGEQYLHNDTRGGRDPYNRPMMESFSTTTTAYLLVSKLSALRRSNPALAYGSMTRRWINRDVYIYERKFFGNVILVAINKSLSHSYDIGDLRTALPSGDYSDHLGGQLGGLPIKVSASAGDLASVERFVLPPHGVAVWSYLDETAAPRVGSVYPTAGQAGMQVTIAGQAFGATPGSVKFGESVAEVISWSESNIRAVVPANSTGDNKIVVTTQPGQSSNERNFKVLTARLIPVVVNLKNAPALDPGDRLFVVGDVTELGAWKATWEDSAGPLITSNGTDWFLCIALPAGQKVQFKFIVIGASGSVRWSNGDAHTLPAEELSIGLHQSGLAHSGRRLFLPHIVWAVFPA